MSVCVCEALCLKMCRVHGSFARTWSISARTALRQIAGSIQRGLFRAWEIPVAERVDLAMLTVTVCRHAGK